MKNWIMILGLVVAMMLAACQEREQVTVAPPADRESPAVGEQSRQPAATDQQQTATAPTASQPTTDQGVAGSPSTTMPSGNAMTRPDTTAGQTAQPGATDNQVAATPARPTEETPGAAGDRKSTEFLGQSPPFGNAPETIVLKASNGNVTLPHKQHAQTMDCKTCHGAATPGPIEGFSKAQAHDLCVGCHKQNNAGPTKCQDCHKKQ